MNNKQAQYDYNWVNPRNNYELGPQVNAFLDQPIPLHEEPQRIYGAQSMQQNRTNRDNILNGPIPQQIRSRDMTIEDIGSIQGIKAIDDSFRTEPVFRVTRFIANSKYSSTQYDSNSLEWNMGPFVSRSGNSTIPITEEYFGGVVGIKVFPFDIPTSLFSTSDTYFGTVGLSVPNMMQISKTGIQEPQGPPSSPSMARYLFDLTLSASAQSNRTRCTPNSETYWLMEPVRVDATWRVQFTTPMTQAVTIPACNWQGIMSNTNPAVITTATPTNLQAGDQITLETAIPGLAYTSSTTIFSVTVLTPTTFSIPLDTSSLTTTTTIQFCIITREIRMIFELIGLDRTGNLTNSTRAGVFIQ